MIRIYVFMGLVGGTQRAYLRKKWLTSKIKKMAGRNRNCASRLGEEKAAHWKSVKEAGVNWRRPRLAFASNVGC